MLVLTSLDDAVSIVLSQPSTLSVHASCFDRINGVTLPVRFNTIVENLGETPIVLGPRPGSQRQIGFLSIHNDSVNLSSFSIKHDDGTSKITIWNGQLSENEFLVLDKNSSWSFYRSNGSIKYS